MEQNKTKTLAGLTDEEIQKYKDKQERARKLSWYALVVSSQHERQVLEAITGKPDPYKRGGKASRKAITPLNPPLEAYVPIREEKRQWSDRTKIVPVILVPSVVFVRLRMSEDKLRVLSLDESVKLFIYNKERREPECIPDRQMQQLMAAVQDAPDLSIKEPELGDTVQVINGPFKGYVGEIIRSDGGGTKFQLRLTHNMAGVFSIDLDNIKVVPRDTLTEYPDERFR